MSKGKRREREAADLYERAGYDTFRPQESKFGETDMFGLFDLLAVAPDEPPVLAQVKSNRAEGIRQFDADAQLFAWNDHLRVHYLVCHDREGWRVATFDGGGYRWVCDERAEDCRMGEGVVEWLGGEM